MNWQGQSQRPVNWRPAASPAWTPRPGVVVQPAPQAGPNTIVVQGPGLGHCADGELDEACRQVAIVGGFSVHDTVRIVHPGLAHVEFPHREAATQFEEVTRGELMVGVKSFQVRHPLGTLTANFGAISDASATDTLMVRQLGSDISEDDIIQAFSKVAPRIKSVKIPKSWSGQPKGHAFVAFHELHEAISALRHFRASVGTISGRRVTADFAPVQTFEETLELEAQQKKADINIKESHAQALSGPNADMWASYLAMFNTSGGEDKSKPSGADQSAMGMGGGSSGGFPGMKAEDMESAAKRMRTEYAAPPTQRSW